MKRRTAQLPLHGGKAPRWLFQRMHRLAGAITMAIVDEHGPATMLERLSDPWWFQAFGCALGFDWHSSGLTTVTCGALKQAYKRLGDDLGIVVAGGKGGTSRKAPQEIAAGAEHHGLSDEAGGRLVFASRMSAKVDSAAVQDGFQVYHHSFFFTPEGAWCVVQQGMNTRHARRYHWLGEHVADFVCEPHTGLRDDGPRPRQLTLNLVAEESDPCRAACASLILEDPDRILGELELLTEGPTLFAPDHHPVLPADVNLPRLRTIFRSAHEAQPSDFQALLGTAGVGPATVRALALLAELIHGAPPSQRDIPAREDHQPRWADYSYAHGGKDGFPFPVDRTTYDRSIDVLERAVVRARLGHTDERDALRRIAASTPGD